MSRGKKIELKKKYIYIYAIEPMIEFPKADRILLFNYNKSNNYQLLLLGYEQ